MSFACIHFHENFCIVIKYSHYAALWLENWKTPKWFQRTKIILVYNGGERAPPFYLKKKRVERLWQNTRNFFRALVIWAARLLSACGSVYISWKHLFEQHAKFTIRVLTVSNFISREEAFSPKVEQKEFLCKFFFSTHCLLTICLLHANLLLEFTRGILLSKTLF